MDFSSETWLFTRGSQVPRPSFGAKASKSPPFIVRPSPRRSLPGRLAARVAPRARAPGRRGGDGPGTPRGGGGGVGGRNGGGGGEICRKFEGKFVEN